MNHLLMCAAVFLLVLLFSWLLVFSIIMLPRMADWLEKKLEAGE